MGDVTIEAKHAAAGDRLERELDVAAACGAPLIVCAAWVHDPRGQLPHLVLDVGDRAVIAALDGEAENLRDGFAGPAQLGRIAHHVVELIVGKLPAHIRAVQREIVAALGHAAAHANRLRNRDEHFQSGDARDFGAQAVHDIVDRGHTLPARLEVDHEAPGVGGTAAKSPAGARVKGFHIGILYDDRGHQLLISGHLVIRGALRGLGLNEEIVVVGVRDEALVHHRVEPAGSNQHCHKRGQHHRAVPQHPSQRDVIEPQHGVEDTLQPSV